jgi:hypothetical protein
VQGRLRVQRSPAPQYRYVSRYCLPAPSLPTPYNMASRAPKACTQLRMPHGFFPGASACRTASPLPRHARGTAYLTLARSTQHGKVIARKTCLQQGGICALALAMECLLRPETSNPWRCNRSQVFAVCISNPIRPETSNSVRWPGAELLVVMVAWRLEQPCGTCTGAAVRHMPRPNPSWSCLVSWGLERGLEKPCGSACSWRMCALKAQGALNALLVLLSALIVPSMSSRRLEQPCGRSQGSIPCGRTFRRLQSSADAEQSNPSTLPIAVPTDTMA